MAPFEMRSLGFYYDAVLIGIDEVGAVFIFTKNHPGRQQARHETFVGRA